MARLSTNPAAKNKRGVCYQNPAGVTTMVPSYASLGAPPTHLLYSLTRSEDSNSSAIASAGTSMVHHARMHANLLERRKRNNITEQNTMRGEKLSLGSEHDGR